MSKYETRERYDWIRRKNIIEPLTWTYTWDGAGQLVGVKNNDKVNLRFEYDALGLSCSIAIPPLENAQRPKPVWGLRQYGRLT